MGTDAPLISQVNQSVGIGPRKVPGVRNPGGCGWWTCFPVPATAPFHLALCPTGDFNLESEEGKIKIFWKQILRVGLGGHISILCLRSHSFLLPQSNLQGETFSIWARRLKTETEWELGPGRAGGGWGPAWGFRPFLSSCPHCAPDLTGLSETWIQTDRDPLTNVNFGLWLTGKLFFFFFDASQVTQNSSNINANAFI